MTKTVIFIRHGKTQYSLENRFMGRIDAPLIDHSIEQFHSALGNLEKYKPTTLIVSPLLRAVQSAEIIRSCFSFDHVEENALLVERDFGRYEGQFKTPQNRNAIDHCPSAEPRVKVKKRLVQFLQTALKSEVTAILSHSNIYKTLLEIEGIGSIFLDSTLPCGQSAIITL